MLFKFLFKCLLKFLFFAKMAYDLAQKELRQSEIEATQTGGTCNPSGNPSGVSKSFDAEWDKLQHTFQSMQQKILGSPQPEPSLEVNALRADIAALRAEIRALKNEAMEQATDLNSDCIVDNTL